MVHFFRALKDLGGKAWGSIPVKTRKRKVVMAWRGWVVVDLHIDFKTEGVIGLDECLLYEPFTWNTFPRPCAGWRAYVDRLTMRHEGC